MAHDVASKECRRVLYEAYDLNRRLNGKVIGEEELQSLRRKLEEEKEEEDKRQDPKSKKLKQTRIGS